MSRAFLLYALAALAVSPLRAYDLFDYWLNPPGVCTAADPNDSGTFSYQYSGGKSCSVSGRGSLPLYLLAKGGWADESFASDGTWLYILSERHPDLCASNYGYRRWDASGTTGIRWAKISFTNTTVTWTHPAHTLRCGLTCGSYNGDATIGAGDYNEQGILGMIWDKLYDCRSGSCIGPIPMETMVVRGYWAQHTNGPCGTHFDHAEEYWYGRADITNDGVNNPQSIGLVRWVHNVMNDSTCTYSELDSSWISYLKNCNLAASCPFC
jgi:hypothetical protein